MSWPNWLPIVVLYAIRRHSWSHQHVIISSWPKSFRYQLKANPEYERRSNSDRNRVLPGGPLRADSGQFAIHSNLCPLYPRKRTEQRTFSNSDSENLGSNPSSPARSKPLHHKQKYGAQGSRRSSAIGSSGLRKRATIRTCPFPSSLAAPMRVRGLSRLRRYGVPL